METKEKDIIFKEFLIKGYGLHLTKSYSKNAQEYIKDRYKRGVTELKASKGYPTKTGENGYTKLLGVWTFTKSRGLDSAIGLKRIWTASILNMKKLI